MKKTSHLDTVILALLTISTILYLIWQFGRSYGRTEGLRIGKSQATLSDICFEVEEAGEGADFNKGIHYEIFKCSIIDKRNVKVEDYFRFEGNWDKCDENGENCVPFVRDSQEILPTFNL